MAKGRSIIEFLDSKKSLALIAGLFLLIIIIGFLYLVTMIEKVKLTDYKNQLIRQNKQLNADLSRVKLELDEKVDLSKIEEHSRRELKMVDVEEVNYIKVE